MPQSDFLAKPLNFGAIGLRLKLRLLWLSCIFKRHAFDAQILIAYWQFVNGYFLFK